MYNNLTVLCIKYLNPTVYLAYQLSNSCCQLIYQNPTVQLCIKKERIILLSNCVSIINILLYTGLSAIKILLCSGVSNIKILLSSRISSIKTLLYQTFTVQFLSFYRTLQLLFHFNLRIQLRLVSSVRYRFPTVA